MLKNDLSSALESIAKDWKKAKRQADKQDRVSSFTLNRMRYRPQRVTIRDVAFSGYGRCVHEGIGEWPFTGKRPANLLCRPAWNPQDQTGETSLNLSTSRKPF